MFNELNFAFLAEMSMQEGYGMAQVITMFNIPVKVYVGEESDLSVVAYSQGDEKDMTGLLCL